MTPSHFNEVESRFPHMKAFCEKAKVRIHSYCTAFSTFSFRQNVQCVRPRTSTIRLHACSIFLFPNGKQKEWDNNKRATVAKSIVEEFPAEMREEIEVTLGSFVLCEPPFASTPLELDVYWRNRCFASRSVRVCVVYVVYDEAPLGVGIEHIR